MSNSPSEVARLASEGFNLFESYTCIRQYDEEIAIITTYVPDVYQFTELEELGVWDTFTLLLENDQNWHGSVPKKTIAKFQERLDSIFFLYRDSVDGRLHHITPAYLVRRAINDLFTILKPGEYDTTLEPKDEPTTIALKPKDEPITLESGDEATGDVIKPGDEAFVGLVARYIDTARWSEFLAWKCITPTESFLSSMLAIRDGIKLMEERPTVEATLLNIHDQADTEWNNIKNALSNVANTEDRSVL